MATIAENLLQLNEAKQAIKTAIENKGQDLTDIPFTGYAEKINQIAGSGNDEFWDLYQENGNRTNYTNCFSGVGWNNNTFKPKHDIVAKVPIRMFAYSGIEGNLVQILKDLGITMTVDIGGGRNANYMLQGSKITHFPDVRFSDAYSYVDIFRDASYLTDVNITNIRAEKAFGPNCFYGCTSLKNVTFGGTIGNNISLSPCPLSKASIESLINALSSTATGQTATLKKTAVDTEFETAEGLADGSTSTEWATLIATKSNWTISLA